MREKPPSTDDKDPSKLVDEVLARFRKESVGNGQAEDFEYKVGNGGEVDPRKIDEALAKRRGDVEPPSFDVGEAERPTEDSAKMQIVPSFDKEDFLKNGDPDKTVPPGLISPEDIMAAEEKLSRAPEPESVPVGMPSPEAAKKESVAVALSEVRGIIASQLGTKATINKLELEETPEGIRLSAELDAGWKGGKISIDGRVVNSGIEIAVQDLHIQARGYVKSRIEDNISRFAPAIKSYFEEKYGKPVSSIQIGSSGLAVGLESEIVRGNEPTQSEKSGVSPNADKSAPADQQGSKVEAPKTVPSRKWEDIPPDERKEKYGKSAELREQILELRKTRVNVAILEQGLRGRSLESVLAYREEKERDRDLRRSPRDAEKVLKKEKEVEYLKLLERYEGQRTRYIGAKAWRMLKERTALAEEKGEIHGKGLWERTRRGWRWLGDQNAEKLGWKSNNVVGKVTGRMLSVRTLVSGALFGLSFTPLGTAAVGVRQAMRGTGATFTSYDSMRRWHEAKAGKIDKEPKDMSPTELEEHMANMEALALTSGERMVQSDAYQTLQEEYLNRIAPQVLDTEGKKTAHRAKLEHGSVPEKLQELDAILREKQEAETKLALRQKVKAVGIGVVSAFGLSSVAKGWGMIGDLAKHSGAGSDMGAEAVHKLTRAVAGAHEAHTSEEAIKAVHKTMTPDELQKILNGPVFSNEQYHELIAQQAKLPESVMNAAEHGKVFDTHFEPLKPSTSGLQAAEHATESVKAPGEIIGTIKRGGSAWAAAREWLKTGKITPKQFNEAWSSSQIRLQSGEYVPLAQVGLTHSGDQLVYHATDGTTPAYFEIVDHAKENLFGKNEELAEAFHAAGKPLPKWLHDAIEAKLPGGHHAAHAFIEDGVSRPSVDSGLFGSDEVSVTHADNLIRLSPEEVAYDGTQEVIHGSSDAAGNILESTTPELQAAAAQGALRVAERGLSFDWGKVDFVLNERGDIVHVQLWDKMRPWRYAEFAKKAAEDMLRPDFEDVLKDTNIETLQKFDISGSVAEMANEFGEPYRLAFAKDAAMKVIEYQDILRALPGGPKTPEAQAVLKAIDVLRSRTEILLGKIFQ